MKQINDLIVVEVPKDSRNHKIIEMGLSKYCQWDIRLATGVDKLPPGNYEIIGVYSEVVNDEDKRVEVLNYGHSSGLVYTMLLDAGIDCQKIPNTTDLLFIKKTK